MKGFGVRKTDGILCDWTVCDESSNTGCREGMQNEFRTVTIMKPSVTLEPELRLHITGLRNDYCKLFSSDWGFCRDWEYLRILQERWQGCFAFRSNGNSPKLMHVIFFFEICCFKNCLSQDVEITDQTLESLSPSSRAAFFSSKSQFKFKIRPVNIPPC